MSLAEEIDAFIKGKHHRLINSVLVYRNGEIAAECYYNGFTKNSRNSIKSICKSITSVCAGICLDQGYIQDLNVPIFHYLPQFNGENDPMHRQITIKHLLTMSSGIYWNGGVHYHCPMLAQMRYSKSWVDYIADTAMKFHPGSRYIYKEFDLILLGALLEKAIGGELFDFLNENLYQPLGIQSDRWWKSRCDVPYSVALGDEGPEEQQSSLTARDLLRIGQLYLQNGVYNGKQIISERYIKECTSPSRSEKGYGYMWWLGDDWYGCRGFGGQNITVFPKQNAIFVMQATPTPRGMSYYDVFEYVHGMLHS